MPLDPVALDDPHVPAHNEERDAINQLEIDVAARIPHPSGAATGDLLRWDGTKWVTTDTRFMEGNGRPDGVVAAPVGSRYIDKTGAQGAVEWVKRAGVDSNQGWMCLAGDTGPRNVQNLVSIGNGDLYNAILVRVGQVIELHLDITMPSNKPSPWLVLTLPVGFRPVYSRYGALTDNKEGADTGGTLVNTGGGVYIYNPVANKRDRYSGNWLTRDAWPTALPGSPI